MNEDTDKNIKGDLLSETKRKFSRSIGINKDKKKGEIIENEDIIWRKPGGYLSEQSLKEVIGKKAKYNLDRFNLINIEDLE